MALTVEPMIHDIFEPRTGTWQYIVADPSTKKAAIIDSVLDFDPATNTATHSTADNLLSLVAEHSYAIDYILETHVHADHITAAKYLQRQLSAKQDQAPAIGIGKRVKQVQEQFARRYEIPEIELAGAFDKLFDDDEVFRIGGLEAKAMHLPGHTPDHLGYVIGANIFCGDSLFNPDVGSARCDFPGGSAAMLYSSVRKLLSLPSHYRVFTGHDYPPSVPPPAPAPADASNGRPAAASPRTPLAATTVAMQNRENKHLKDGVEEQEFVAWRAERDASLSLPKLIHQSLQFNIRGGEMPAENADGDRLLRLPLKMQGML